MTRPGFAGLGAAKSYLQCAPETKLVILDAVGRLGDACGDVS